MGFKDLPSDLVAAAAEILEASDKKLRDDYEKLYAEALAKFGVKSVDELSEDARKEFNAWFIRNLDNSVNLNERSIDQKLDDNKKDEKVEEELVTENIAISPIELAGNEAIGCRTETEKPKHVDVLREYSPLENRTEYRLFIQFPTNTRSVIIPPVSLPGAPSLSALREIIEALPFAEECEKAIAEAENLPSLDPRFRGNDKE